jgi:hypothetical protein
MEGEKSADQGDEQNAAAHAAKTGDDYQNEAEPQKDKGPHPPRHVAARSGHGIHGGGAFGGHSGIGAGPEQARDEKAGRRDQNHRPHRFRSHVLAFSLFT